MADMGLDHERAAGKAIRACQDEAKRLYAELERLREALNHDVPHYLEAIGFDEAADSVRDYIKGRLS